MAASVELLKKLQVKPGAKLWLIHAPKEIEKALAAAGNIKLVKAGAAFDGAIAFCDNPGEVADFTKRILAKVPEDALVWFAYRKGAAARQSGLSRDVGWQPLFDAGWRGVRSISFDDTWTGLRFRPEALVKRKPRAPTS